MFKETSMEKIKDRWNKVNYLPAFGMNIKPLEEMAAHAYEDIEFLLKRVEFLESKIVDLVTMQE